MIAKTLLDQVVNGDLLQLREMFQASGFDIRFVGGCVRDIMNNTTPKDIDLCTDAFPDEAIEVYSANGLHFIPTGIDHGTITVMLNGVGYEITSLRTETEHDGRHASVAYTRDWEEDLSRRDLTINAMALTFDGDLLDPFNGAWDVVMGNVKFVGDARERIREDYLRILRFFRFHGRFGRLGETGFDRDAMDAIKANYNGLTMISAERKWTELRGIVAGRNAELILHTLYEICGATLFMPSNNFEGLEEVQQRTKNPASLFAFVLKSVTDTNYMAKHLKWSAEDRDLACKLCNDDTEISHHSHTNTRDLEYMIVMRGDTKEYVKEFLRVVDRMDMIPFVDQFVVPKFPINGHDLLAFGLKGRGVGERLARHKHQWFESMYTLTKEQLLEGYEHGKQFS